MSESMSAVPLLPASFAPPHFQDWKKEENPSKSMVGGGGVSLKKKQCLFRNLFHKSPNLRQPLSKLFGWLIGEKMAPNPPS